MYRSSVLQDLRHALRLFVQRPWLALVTVLTLGLGIGANTAVIAVVNAVLLRPYPHVETDRWAYLYESPKAEGLSLVAVSLPNYRDWKAGSRSFADMVLWMPWSYNLSGDGAGEAERVQAAVITPEVFAALGLQPAAGRFLLPSDDPASAERPVVIGHGLWQRRFGGALDVAGRTIVLNLVPHTVVGVAPAEFSFPPETRTEVWAPFAAAAIAADSARGGRGYRVAGRLAPGATFPAAETELRLIADRLAAEHPEDRGYSARVVPMREGVSGDLRTPLLALLGAVALVLLLACVNLANLQLVRLEARQRELALRAAVGAGRGRLVRQLLAESALLAGGGALLGLLLAPVGVRLLLALVPPAEVPYLRVTLDPRVLLGFAAVAGVVALIAGVLPALRASRVDLVSTLTGSVGVATSRPHRRLRHALLVAQLALSLVPLVGAALLLQSFHRLRAVDPGFEAQKRLTLSFAAPRARYPAPEKIASLAEAVGDAVRAAPGVKAAGVAQHLPFAIAMGWMQAVSREDPRGVVDPGRLPHVRYNVVSSGYVEAVGVPLKAGRPFTQADERAASPVVIVNEALARRHFGERSPVGERLWVGHAPDLATTPPRTIVGVVGNTRIERLEDEPEAAAFVPLAQQEFGESAWRTLFLVAHTEGDPKDRVPAIRTAIAGVDRDLALTGIETMESRLDTSLWRHRLSARVVAAFGLAALAIAVLGVFGIVGYLVSQRAHEIGVRMALGATRERIARMVVGESLRLILLGVCLGAAGALALGRTLSGLLYGVRGDDPATLAGLSLLLVAAALLACLVPAGRAARLSPLAAIRRD